MPVPKPEPHARAKARAEREQAKADRLVYAAVTARDRGCRACGRWDGEMHRHHLRGRRFTTTSDVCVLCDQCHGDVHVRVGGKRLRLSGNADGRLLVERRYPDGNWYSWGLA